MTMRGLRVAIGGGMRADRTYTDIYALLKNTISADKSGIPD